MRCPKCDYLMDCIATSNQGSEWGCMECGFSCTAIITTKKIKKKKDNYNFDISEINDLQTRIMQYVEDWVNKRKTPVPLIEIKKNMVALGVKGYTTLNAIRSLIEKKYIRKAVTSTNKTYYVQIRRL